MTNSPKSGERERWDWDSVTEISNKSGIGMISEYDRQAIRALKTQYEVSLKRIEKLRAALEHIDGDFNGYCEVCSNFMSSDEATLKHYNKLATDALADDQGDDT